MKHFCLAGFLPQMGSWANKIYWLKLFISPKQDSVSKGNFIKKHWRGSKVRPKDHVFTKMDPMFGWMLFLPLTYFQFWRCIPPQSFFSQNIFEIVCLSRKKSLYQEQVTLWCAIRDPQQQHQQGNFLIYTELNATVQCHSAVSQQSLNNG